jgi:uncharacterized membrane protein
VCSTRLNCEIGQTKTLHIVPINVRVDYVLGEENSGRLAYGFSVRWVPRAGPVLFVSWKNRRLGFALFCHRREDRCLKVLGHTTFLCARCTGICIGAFFAMLLLVTHTAVPLISAAILCLPLLADGFSQLSGFRESNNALRFLTGVAFSVGLLLLMFQR